MTRLVDLRRYRAHYDIIVMFIEIQHMGLPPEEYLQVLILATNHEIYT